MRTHTMMFATVGVLLLYLVGLSVCDVCDDAPGVNGCSIPGNLPFFYKNKFRSACNKHDVCYACGAYHGISRLSCDTKFKSNMKKKCGWNAFCKIFANIYYKAVRTFGKDRYHSVSKDWCDEAWVDSCL